MIDRGTVTTWMDQLKAAWEAGNGPSAAALFQRTERYFERPFRPGTSQEEIRGYWKDIDGLENIRFEYDIAAVEGSTACVHWKNWFDSPSESKSYELDGMFQIDFDDDGWCREFRQWWFMRQ